MCGECLNVKDYPSIQMALDSLPATGGALYFPVGAYRVCQTLHISLEERQHLYLFGAGRGSVLYNDNREGQPLLHITGAKDSWWPDLRITIRDLAFRGNPESADALCVDYPNDLLVDACFFQGHGGAAIRLGPQGTNVTIRDCWMRDCKQALWAENIHHLSFHGNQTRSLPGGQKQAAHIFIGWECREVRIVSNHLAYGQAQAIVLDGTAQHIIANNTIEGFPLGIEAHGKGISAPRDFGRDVIIAHNYIHADTGILLCGPCQGFIIVGNMFLNNPAGAVRLTEAAQGGGHLISQNIIRKSVYDGEFVPQASPKQGGIYLEEASGCLVQGNLFSNITLRPAIQAAFAFQNYISDNWEQ